MKGVRVCDYCHKEIKYDIVSCYAETTYLLKVPGFQAGDGWLEGIKPVMRQKNIGYGRFAIVCAECEKRDKVRVEDEKNSD